MAAGALGIAGGIYLRRYLAGPPNDRIRRLSRGFLGRLPLLCL